MNKTKTILKKMKSLFEEEDDKSVDYVDIKTKDGKILRVDDVLVDAKVKEVDEDGVIDIDDGDYTLEDGTILTIVGGVITEIKEADEEDKADEDSEKPTDIEASEFAKITSITKWELNVTADKIEVGTELKTLNEEGEEVPIYDGEYELEDGRLIQVDADGVVVLITDPADEEGENKPESESESKPESDDSDDSDDSDEFNEQVFSKIEKIVKELKKLKTENKKFSEKLEKFGKEASDKHTDENHKFSNNVKPSSKLSNALRYK